MKYIMIQYTLSKNFYWKEFSTALSSLCFCKWKFKVDQKEACNLGNFQCKNTSIISLYWAYLEKGNANHTHGVFYVCDGVQLERHELHVKHICWSLYLPILLI